ncbi:MAG: AAA family ATPase, partial [Flavobacteriaceae bacterium]|nr:AAA family ATPase [Flavobacteriaceae bacterium]
ESFLIGYLTPEEYFYFIGELRGQSKAEVSDLLSNFEDFFHGEILGQKKYLRDLSKGNQKKVGIVATFIGSPEVVILDEPFANLDPTTQIRLKGIIKDLAASSGVTVLVSSHDLMHVTEVCERIVVLEKGQIVKDIVTAPATLKELEAYFSGAAHRPSLETESPESVPSENAHLEGSSPAIATEGVAEEGEK